MLEETLQDVVALLLPHMALPPSKLVASVKHVIVSSPNEDDGTLSAVKIGLISLLMMRSGW